MKYLKKMCTFLLVLCMVMGCFVQNVNAESGSSSQNETIYRRHEYILTSDMKIIDMNIFRSNQPSDTGGGNRIVLGSYILSREQTKDLANNMRLWGSSWPSFIVGIANPLLGLIVSLSGNAQFNNDVVYAAAHNKRVRVTLTDSPVHTSYSQRVEYEVID